MSSVRPAVVAGHGDFADGMISAVRQITGRGEGLIGLTNRDLAARDIEAMLRDAIAGDARVIFTDLPAGSWTLAARRVMRSRDDIVLVTGVNLATLLDFVMHAADSDASAARHAVDKGRASIAVMGAPSGD